MVQEKHEIEYKDFQIYFGGGGHEVDADTFVSSLMAVSTIIQEVNKEVAPDKRIQVKVKALNEGSFEVFCALVQNIGGSLVPLFNSSNISYLSNLFTILTGLFELRKFLGGKEPNQMIENGDDFTIENVTGNQMIFNNSIVNMYFSNQTVNDAMSKNFEKLNEDQNVKSFELKSGENKVFYSDRNDFPTLQEKRIVAEDKVKEITKQNVSLKILKLVWNDDNKWSFVYDGNKISAFVRDVDFFKKIDEGEKFAKGDELIVDLKIVQIYDKTIDGYINNDYEIIVVHSHKPRPEQPPLLFEK